MKYKRNKGITAGMATPEIDKMEELQPEIATIQDFVVWAMETGALVETKKEHPSIRQLVAAYLDIDLAAADAERRAVLVDFERQVK